MARVSQQYVEQYAEYAIEQQRKYGVPASVTLAQGILESANGRSQLSRECKNHFGIKAGKSWLDAGGQYGLYTDDKPNEKFCKYASVGDIMGLEMLKMQSMLHVQNMVTITETSTGII